MENNRPKISSLTEKELATILQDCFFKIGKQLKLSVGDTKIFLDEVYRHHGWMYVDTFSEAFSRYAACELSDAENLRPYVSPLFIGKLMKIYTRKRSEQRSPEKRGKDNATTLNPEEKYTLFLKHLIANKSLPANPDWVCIYQYLAGLKKLSPVAGWDSLGYSKKLKQATVAVSEWAYKHFTITENLIYKNAAAR